MKRVMMVAGLVLAYSMALQADNLPTDGLNDQILYWDATATTGSNAKWGDPSTIPGLQGPQGIQGVQGEQGIQGIQGVAGLDGKDGTNGTDGAAGVNGVDGAKGDKGDKGDTGTAGTSGKDGSNGKDGTNGKDGKNGTNGVNGRNLSAPAIDPRIEVEVREYDAQHWSLASFSSFALQTGTARYIVGQKLTLKLGKSYEERRLDMLEHKLQELQKDAVLLLQ